MAHATRSLSLAHKLSLIGCSVALALPAAAAEDHGPSDAAPPHPRFGTRSQWVFGVEGLATIGYAPPRESSIPPAQGLTGGSIGRQTNSLSSLSVAGFSPRIGADFFVANHLSLGLGAAYTQTTSWFKSTAALPEGNETSEGHGTDHSLRLSPRVGVAYTAASGFGVWGRAGVDFADAWHTAHFGTVDFKVSYYSLAARMEALATYTPRRDVVLMAGPWLTQELTAWTSGLTFDFTERGAAPPNFGLTLGAALYL